MFGFVPINSNPTTQFIEQAERSITIAELR